MTCVPCTVSITDGVLKVTIPDHQDIRELMEACRIVLESGSTGANHLAFTVQTTEPDTDYVLTCDGPPQILVGETA